MGSAVWSAIVQIPNGKGNSYSLTKPVIDTFVFPALIGVVSLSFQSDGMRISLYTLR